MKSKLIILLVLLAFVVTAQAQTPHSVTLNWAASPTTGVTGYNVYRFTGACAANITFTKLTASPITPLTFVDTAVTAGTTYCYSVTAVSPGGESPGAGMWQTTVPTFTASTVPLPPAGLSGTVQ
jgi:hypothetical protein